MAIENETSKVTYNANGVTTTFDITFDVQTDSVTGNAIDIAVVLTDSSGAESTLTPTTDYTVSGKTIVTVATYAAGEKITIVRNVPRTQTLDLVEGGQFSAEAIERALDKLTIQGQETAELTDRVVKLPVTEAQDMILPTEVARANRVLGFDEDGKPMAAAGVTAAVSAFMETVLDDPDAETALATLGFTAFVRGLRAAADKTAWLEAAGISTNAIAIIEELWALDRWGDASDGAIAALDDAAFNVDGNLNATTIATTGDQSLTHNRIARATGAVAIDHVMTIGVQDGADRQIAQATTWGGYGHHDPYKSIVPMAGTRLIRAPERPGSNALAKNGGVIQIIAKGAVTIDGSIVANGATAAADDGGSGGGLVIVVSETSIAGAGSISAAGTDAGATLASRGGGGGYGGHGGFCGFKGSGGGGGGVKSGGYPALSVAGAHGIFGTGGGRGGGSSLGSAGGGGGGLTSAGVNAGGSFERTGGNGGQAMALPTELIGVPRRATRAAITSWGQEFATVPTTDGANGGPASEGSPGIGGGAAGGGGGGGYRTSGTTGVGGSGGTSAGGGGAGWSDNAGVAGGAGGTGGTAGSSGPRLRYRDGTLGLHDGGQGGNGGGGGGAGASGGSGGTGGTAGVGEPSIGDGWGSGANGTAGANGGNSPGSTGTPGGNGGSGGNGGGAAGCIVLIAPTVDTSSLTITGRLVTITGDEARAVITRYVA